MGNNNNSGIGEIIKTVAIIVGVAGIIGGIIIAASDAADAYGLSFFSFFFFAFASAISACLLYGFGVLISNVNDIKVQLMKAETKKTKDNMQQKKSDNTVVIEHKSQPNTKVVTHEANENADKEMFNDLPKL